MSDRPTAFSTDYGMAWYPEDSEAHIFVERLATLNGRAVLSVRSERKGIPTDQAPFVEIAVSKGGRRITVYPVRGDVQIEVEPV